MGNSVPKEYELGPDAQQARNTKTYTRFVIDGLVLIIASITMLRILVNKSSYKAPIVLTQLAMLLTSYAFLTTHNSW